MVHGFFFFFFYLIGLIVKNKIKKGDETVYSASPSKSSLLSRAFFFLALLSFALEAILVTLGI
jgi:hypothetical protein